MNLSTQQKFLPIYKNAYELGRIHEKKKKKNLCDNGTKIVLHTRDILENISMPNFAYRMLKPKYRLQFSVVITSITFCTGKIKNV